MWKYFPPSDGQELRGAFAITILRLGVSVRVLMLDALEKENHVHSTYDSVTNIYENGSKYSIHTQFQGV